MLIIYDLKNHLDRSDENMKSLRMIPGHHVVKLSLEGVASGPYFLKLNMNGDMHAELIIIL